jgi:O-methyltransferase involved in polyketide biosynthesis
MTSPLPSDANQPTVPNAARIIYSDLDPETYALAQTLVGELPNVRYFQHDVREPLSLLESPAVREFLGGERRVAFGLSGVSAFLTADELRHLFHDLYAWAAPGSRLYITYETKQPHLMTPQIEQFLAMFEQAGVPFYLYTRDPYPWWIIRALSEAPATMGRCRCS